VRGPLLLLLACVAAPSSGGEEPARAFIEVRASAPRCYVGEPLRLLLRIGLDRDWFREHGVQLLRQRLDLPAAVSAPWLAALAGARALAPPTAIPGSQTLRLVVNDEAVAAAASPEVAVGGRIFTVVEVERSYLPQVAGTLEIAAPGLRFSYATHFEEDLFHGRVPKDRRDARVEGEALQVEVEPLPEEGRPGGFGGAVGRFAIRSEADRAEVALGEAFHLTLRIEANGASNIEIVAAPRLDHLDGFHVFGTVESRERDGLSATYEIAPLRAEIAAIPSIRFDFFDPAPPGRYASAATGTIPLRVLGRGERSASEGGGRLLPAIFGVFAVAAALVWLRSRRRAEARERERQRGAYLRCTAELARPDTDPAQALTEYLAARLGCAAAAVITPDLAERLVARGIPAPVAKATASALERLVAARYGATEASGATRSDLARLTGEIEQALDTRTRAT